MNRSRYLFLLLLLSTFCAALLIAPSRSSAITYGFVDAKNTYSNVGAFIVKSPSEEIFPICSGTLIAPNVFLTASHCTSYFTQELEPLGYTAYVSFDKSIPFGDLTTTKTKLLVICLAEAEKH